MDRFGGGADALQCRQPRAERAGPSATEMECGARLSREANALLVARRNVLSHQLPGEPALPTRARLAGAGFSSVAENVAYGPSASAIQAGWMNSPPHRANLLDTESDALGIAVVEQNGRLFAVEDFARVVNRVPLDEQARQVGALLAASGLTLVGDNGEAEKACRSDKGLNLGQRTLFVLRYSTADLSHLPDALIREIKTERYHAASVAACAAGQTDFASHQIAVILYR